jgi:hypothetical protein
MEDIQHTGGHKIEFPGPPPIVSEAQLDNQVLMEEFLELRVKPSPKHYKL